MKLPDKQHSTNYFNTFILVAVDCKATVGQAPALNKGQKTVAYRQFELLAPKPYQFTSDEVLFQVYADKNDLTENEYTEARQAFFAKGQPCFRTSPLAKQLGWGIHCDKDGKIALYGVETPQYQTLHDDPTIKKVKAMRNAKPQ